MWFFVFIIFLALYTLTYYIYLKIKNRSFVSFFYLSFFIIILVIIDRANEDWVGLKFFHPLLMNCLYYLFLIISSLQFEFLNKNKTLTQSNIKKNIQIGLGIIGAWVSTDTYFFYS
jgi:hypothetical protein